jgi:protein-disulfide isomerase
MRRPTPAGRDAAWHLVVRTVGSDVMRPIVEDLTPPVDPDRDHWRGGAHAAVTLVEYGDYECPYSRLALPDHPAAGAAVRWPAAVRVPPPAPHPHALAAASATWAAALQGRFWPMHELLFHRQQALEDSDLLGYVDQLGLDRQRLLADLDSRRVWQRVQADADSALESGAQGTPTLFVNGRLHRAGYDQAVLGAALHAASKEA